MTKKQKNSVAGVEQGVHWCGLYPFVQVRSTFASRLPYATHFHDCLSVGAVFSGGTEVRRGGGASKIGAGRAVVIAPFEPHNCNPVGGRPRGYHMFYINADWARALLNAPPGSRLDAKKSVIDDRRLFGALMGLAAAIREGREDSRGREALAEVIAEHCVVRDASAASAFSFSEWAGGEASVEEGARGFGMRRESFIRSFRRVSGMPPAQYRQCVRLNRARELLRAGRGIVDVALACGYADQSHFHRMCVKYLSATPVQIRPVIEQTPKEAALHSV